MIVMKFGGSSIGNSERIKNVAKIVKNNLDEKPIVVISAFQNVTNQLIKIANEALKGNQNLKKIKEIHFKIINNLNLEEKLIEKELKELEIILKGVSFLKELTPKTLDLIMSFGERFSSKIIASYMQNIGINAKSYNSYDIGIVTDSNFNNAEILPETEEKLRKKLRKIKEIPVITGFIAKNKKGYITTLGRGGSDYTATIIGSALKAKEVQIWTDVNGIMTADPKICPNAKTIEKISYEEAYEIAYFGAKVLHPKTILPVKDKNIPIKILNTFNPNNKGTIIIGNLNNENRVVSIVCKKGIKVINIHSPKMFLIHGFLYKVFEIFNDLKISVDLISTSEVNVSLTIDNKYNTEELINKLSKFSFVNVIDKKASISLVGSGINQLPFIIGKIFSSLNKKIKIQMISSGASRINVSFVVNEEFADDSVRILHKEFFENG